MKKIFFIVVICCVGFLAYSNSFHNSFQFDGKREIVESPIIKDISNFSTFSLTSRFISNLTFAINYHLHQLDVVGYHVFNVAIHLGSAILVWWFILLTLSTPAMKGKDIGRNPELIAFFAGLIFVAHPVQTQAVTYIMQRPTSLVTFFYLAGLCFYAKWRLSQINKKSLTVQISCIFGFFIAAGLGIFTKELIITLPLMVILYEVCFLRIKDFLNRRYLIAFLAIIIVIYVTMISPRLHLFNELQKALKANLEIPPGQYILTQLRVLVTYLRLFFIPVNQNIDYDYPVAKAISELPVAASVLFLGFILFVAFKTFSKYRLLSFAIFYFFLALLPEFTVMPLYFFLIRVPREIIFEERLYLPMTGYCLFLVSAVYYLIGRRSLKQMALVFLIITAVYATLTYNRNFVWKDEFTLWSDAVRKSPRKARALNNRGRGYADRGKYEKAISDFTRAIELAPNYTDAYYNRAFIHNYIGNVDQAISDYNKAIKTNPGYYKAYFNLGNIYNGKGDFDKAIFCYNRVLALDKTHTGAYGNRGGSYVRKGDFDQAIADFSKGIEIAPRDGLFRYKRAIIYAKKGDYNEAWKDVLAAEILGQEMDPKFLESLKKASRRQR